MRKGQQSARPLGKGALLVGILAATGCGRDSAGSETCTGSDCYPADGGGAARDSGPVGRDGRAGDLDGAAGADAAPGEPPPALPDGPFGSRTLTIEATRYFASTGLYVRSGDEITLSASGSWTMQGEGSELHGPEGLEFDHDGCPFGSLVASIGLEWETPKQCVGAGAAFEADRAGIVYLAPNDGILEDNRGSVEVEIASPTGIWAPAIEAEHVAAYDLSELDAKWVELLSPEHVILSLPIDVLIAGQSEAASALSAFDSWYAEHRALAGAVPYGGQRVRFYPDPTIEPFAFMLSGNPIRFLPSALSGGEGAYNILKVHDTQYSAWGFVHELGHDFTFINEGWRYMVGSGPTEAWANLYTLFSLERLGHPQQEGPPDHSPPCIEAERDAYLASGTYEEFRDDSWLPLCMLLELRDRHGWQLFESFFASYNASDLSGVPASDASDAERWTWLRDTLDALAGESTTAVFERYRIPLLD